ncbi:MAG: M6 family metalloprotease domain-containing protein [Bacteroidales bacterium]
MKKIITRLLFVAIMLITQISIAVPAYTGLVQLPQPDGSEINAYLFGDERVSWMESEDNYTLMVNKLGYLEYAVIDQKGDMTLSGIVAKNISKRSVMDNNFLSTANKKVRYSEEQIDIMLELTKSMETTKSGAVEGSTVGIRKLLVILVGYQDVPFTSTRQQFENLFNQIGYTDNASTGSVRDYFAACSYGKLDLQCTVVGPFTLPNPRAFYGARTANTNDANSKQMIIDACNAADATVDYSIFDNDQNGIVDGVHIVYAGLGEHNGGGADAIWAHRSRLGAQDFVSNEIVRIIDYSCASEKTSNGSMSGVGVHSHEFGHVLGLWDYYDADYAAQGISKTFADYDVMDAGAYNNNEKTPPIYNAYSKVFLGWASPYIIDSTMLMDITAFHSTDSALIYQINTPTEGEYFLLENKDHSGWNGRVPQLTYYVNNTGVSSGLMAIHVDESPNALGWGNNCLNCNPNRNSVKLMSADNIFTGSESNGSWNFSSMSNLFYPGSSNVTSLTDATTPNLLSWNNLPSNVAITDITRLPSKNITFKVNGGADYGVTVHSLGVSQIDSSSATLSGSAAASVLGDAIIMERGFVINTNPYPRIEDTKIAVIGQTPTYNSTLTNLNPGIRYYARAYGINANGVSYGEQISFITTSDAITNNAIIDSNFAACETGEMPTIIGTDPIGGSGTYLYRWLESTDNVNWTISQNSGINRDYTPSQLTTPRYYKRVVLSAEKSDTSAHIYIPIVPVTVAGDVSIENISIEEGESTGAITITNNVGDVVLWQRKDGNAQWAQIEVGAVSTFSQILETEGTYQYRVRVRNGACPSKQSDAVSVTVMKIGLYDIDKDLINFNIYPNPTNGEFTLDLKLESGKSVDMQIVNLLGKTVSIKADINSTTKINVSNLENGAYILVLRDGSKIVGRKLIQIIK